MFGPIASVTGSSYLHWKHLAPKDTCYVICKTESGIDGVRILSNIVSLTWLILDCLRR